MDGTRLVFIVVFFTYLGADLYSTCYGWVVIYRAWRAGIFR